MNARLIVSAIRNMAAKLLSSAENDILPMYSESGRYLVRRTETDDLIFHFYDVAGDDRYIIPMYDVGTIPNAIERLRDDFEDKNRYDKMTAANLRKKIENSLDHFKTVKESDTTLTREEKKNENPFSVGRSPDKEFDYYMWELLRKKTGESYAWGEKNSSEIHLGERMPRGRFIKSMASKDQQLAKFQFFFYNEEGVNTYIVPLQPPPGEFALSNDKWKDLSIISISELYSKSSLRAKYLFKFLNSALTTTIDNLITKSESMPKKDEDPSEYPIHGIDYNFTFNKWKLTRDDKDFCYIRTTGDKYCRIGNMK